METSPQPPDPRDPKAAGPKPPPIWRSSGMTGLLILLVFLLILPHLAERVQFAITRGQQRAKAEVARRELANMPKSNSRFAWVAKSIEPSVVGIETARLVGQGGFDNQWSQFYAQSGEGSGVIVDEGGYIVTNAHVVDPPSRVTVKLSDGRTIPDATLVGAADWLTDVAVLKIDAGGLVAAPWGDSDSLEVGDEVLAVGNPYRLARTVTAGIVSAKDRPGVVGELAHEGFLQTDAAVNPGNSGGPLVNMRGEIVGINLAIVGESYRGISFAIPSNRVREVYEELRASGKVTPRGYLGVRMVDVTKDLAREFGLEEVSGALIARVEPGAPAERAGIRQGDVIVAWNGTKIEDIRGLALAVARSPVGSTARVVVVRQGQRLEFPVEVAEREPQSNGNQR